MSYSTPVRRLQGGQVLEIAEGGEIRISGGIITKDGVQATAIADVPTGESADDGDNAAAINAILAALRNAGIVAPSA